MFLVWLMPKVFTAVVNTVLYPVHVTSVWLRESEDIIPVYIRDRQTLLGKIKELEDALRIARNNTVAEQELLEENNNLRKLLGVASESRIAAAVIARPNELPYDLLQIDRGTNEGIEVGAPVFAGREIAIGLVAHAAPDYAFVQLFTSPDFRATVFISGPDVVANLEGYGGGVARVRVPQGVPLTVGNLVYIPSIEPGVFGRITQVENVPTQAEQYGFVSPEIALSQLHWVSVGSVSQIARDPAEVEATVLETLNKQLVIPEVALGSLSSTTASSTQSATGTNATVVDTE